MKMSVTIPQIFYDLIARVIPGFLFLLMLGFEFSGLGIEVISLEVSSSNTMVVVLSAIICGVLSYLMGWVLLAFTFFSLGDRVRGEHESAFSSKEDALPMSEMYHRIRIKNEVVGFRIVKLRAEARMLETLRAGMVYVFAISVCLFLLNELTLLSLRDQSALVWGVKLGVPIVLAAAFRRCERRTWDAYFGNVTKHYEILFEGEVEGKQGSHTEEELAA